jgi:hypothetical protein
VKQECKSPRCSEFRLDSPQSWDYAAHGAKRRLPRGVVITLHVSDHAWKVPAMAF